MSSFLIKLTESLQRKYEQFQGLTGLAAIELKRVSNASSKKTTSNSGALKGSTQSIPVEGRVSQQLKNNDHIVCDLQSLDLWVRLKISVSAPCRSLDCAVELKVDRSLSGRDFYLVAQKTCLSVWNSYCESQVSAQLEAARAGAPVNAGLLAAFNQSFVMTEFALHRVVAASLSSSRQHTEELQERKQSKKRARADFLLDLSVGDQFSFQNSEAKVDCVFLSLRQLYAQQHQGEAPLKRTKSALKRQRVTTQIVLPRKPSEEAEEEAVLAAVQPGALQFSHTYNQSGLLEEINAGGSQIPDLLLRQSTVQLVVSEESHLPRLFQEAEARLAPVTVPRRSTQLERLPSMKEELTFAGRAAQVREERNTISLVKAPLWVNARHDHVVLPRKKPCRPFEEGLTTESASLDTLPLARRLSAKKVSGLNDIAEDEKDEVASLERNEDRAVAFEEPLRPQAKGNVMSGLLSSGSNIATKNLKSFKTGSPN